MPWHSRPATHPRVSALPLGARWCPLLSLSTFLSVSLALSRCLRLVARGRSQPTAAPLQHHTALAFIAAASLGLWHGEKQVKLQLSLLLSPPLFFFHLSLLLMANTSQTRLFFKSASAKMVLCLLFVILVFAFSLPPLLHG